MVHFKDYPEFTPNVTPREMFKLGVFGGTYFRPIYSSVTGKNYKGAHREFNFRLDENLLTRTSCDKSLNYYKVVSGTSLDYWEGKGWITAQDPYGWVQWYCRFYAGRRSPDDKRQIARWLAFAGPNGRFKKRLENMIKQGKDSPVIRQGLLQWAFRI